MGAFSLPSSPLLPYVLSSLSSPLVWSLVHLTLVWSVVLRLGVGRRTTPLLRHGRSGRDGGWVGRVACRLGLGDGSLALGLRNSLCRIGRGSVACGHGGGSLVRWRPFLILRIGLDGVRATRYFPKGEAAAIEPSASSPSWKSVIALSKALSRGPEKTEVVRPAARIRMRA